MKKNLLIIVISLIFGQACLGTKTINKRIFDELDQSEVVKVVIEDTFSNENTSEIDTDTTQTNTNDSSIDDSTVDDSNQNTVETKELTEVCGVLYRSSSNHFLMIPDDGNKYFMVTAENTEIENQLEKISFPNDSYSACIWGESKSIYDLLTKYKNINGVTLVASQINLSSLINEFVATNIQISKNIIHPERESLENTFDHSHCGKIEDIEGYGIVLIDANNYSYILEDISSSDIQNSTGTLNACVYGNDSAYTDYHKAFGYFFKVEYISSGWQ